MKQKNKRVVLFLVGLIGFIASLITINQYLSNKKISTFKISEPFIWEVKIIYLVFFLAIVLLVIILPYSIIFRKNIHVKFLKISHFKVRGKYLLHERFEEIIQQIKLSIVKEISAKKNLQGINDFDIRKNVSIYQFGSSSPKRKEFHNTTSNINLLITADNDTVNILLQNLNEIKRQLNNEVKFLFLNINFYTSYQEDKHSIYSGNDLKIYLLVRPREYLIEKSISQPLFILNIINDGECLYGDNQLLSLNQEKIQLSISFTNLLRGTGGIIELKTFLADSAFHIGYNNIAFLRSLKYVILRSFQIFILFKDNKLISKNHELFKLFRNELRMESLSKKVNTDELTTIMKPFFEGSFKLEEHKYKTNEIRHIHNIAYEFIVNIESQMVIINEARKNKYIGFPSRSILENTVNSIIQELLTAVKKFRIQLITHALDDIVLAEYVNNLLIQNGLNSSLFIYESPELLRRFNVSDFENQFRFYNDFENSVDNTLILYVGSGTVIGKLLEVTLRAFYSKFYYKKTKIGIDWGCLLINVNPNSDDKEVWKECFTNLKNNLTFLNYPKIELLISNDGTRL